MPQTDKHKKYVSTLNYRKQQLARGGVYCDCGQPAVKVLPVGFICARCLAIEEKLKGDTGKRPKYANP